MGAQSQLARHAALFEDSACNAISTNDVAGAWILYEAAGRLYGAAGALTLAKKVRASAAFMKSGKRPSKKICPYRRAISFWGSRTPLDYVIARNASWR
jgi:hypothetical protein